MRSAWCKYPLQFRFTARTSRETMRSKDTYYIKIWDDDAATFGIGECGLFRGLSCDDVPGYESMLDAVCTAVASSQPLPDLTGYPSIRMGFETATSDWRTGGRRIMVPSAWTRGEEGIVTNGLVWMGSRDEMLRRIDEKIAAGFRCVKLKIGGIDFDEEIGLLDYIRRAYGPDRLELRLDANGAFTPAEALARLDRLSRFAIHSIEQPIRQGQWREMARICCESPIPIALDEELIGINDTYEKRRMLETVRPSYIILKPTLHGGFSGCDEWINLASLRGIGWWATSALESNIGLNAIAQWVATKNPAMPQGLGTGALYVNNIPSPLQMRGERLFSDPVSQWVIPDLPWKTF